MLYMHEIAKFRSTLRTNLYHGPARQLSSTAQVTLTTYAILRLDAELLAAEDWDMVVLDEAQSIKNSSSQVAKAAFGLKARARVALPAFRAGLAGVLVLGGALVARSALGRAVRRFDRYEVD